MNDERSVFLTCCVQWALAGPLLLTFAGGILVALLKVPTHWGPSVLVLIALALLGIETLTSQAGSVCVVIYCQQRAMSFAQIGYAMMVFHAVMLLLQAAGVTLLLVAVFRRRPAAASPVPPLPSSPHPF